jgi:hypothetical protein
MTTKTHALIIVPAVLGAMTGLFLGVPANATRLPPRTLATPAPLIANADHLPSGSKVTLDADIVLDAVLPDDAGREALEFHADVQEATSEDVKVTYVATLADDADRIVHEARPPAKMALLAGSKKSSSHHVTPRLADGFYSLALTVAALGKNVEDGSTVRRFFEVEAGKIAEISQDDWHRRSNVRAGIYQGPTDPVEAIDAGFRRGAP